MDKSSELAANILFSMPDWKASNAIGYYYSLRIRSWKHSFLKIYQYLVENNHVEGNEYDGVHDQQICYFPHETDLIVYIRDEQNIDSEDCPRSRLIIMDKYFLSGEIPIFGSFYCAKLSDKEVMGKYWLEKASIETFKNKDFNINEVGYGDCRDRYHCFAETPSGPSLESQYHLELSSDIDHALYLLQCAITKIEN